MDIVRPEWLIELEAEIEDLNKWASNKALPVLYRSGMQDRAQVRSIPARIDNLLREVADPRPFPVAIVGETGVGKSTLLNALLDNIVLPTGVVGSQTATFVTVAYAPDWEVRCEYISESELVSLYASAADAADNSIDAPQGDELTQIRKKLHALLELKAEQQLPAAESLRTGPAADLLQFVRDGSRDFHGPEDTKAALKLHAARGRLWPITQSIELRGPFSALERGVVLSDLPGTNDTNKARALRSNAAIETAAQVVIALGPKGFLQSLQDQLNDNRFTHRLLKREETLRVIVVGTSIDKGLPRPGLDDAEIEQLGLDPATANTRTVFAAVCEKWFLEVRQQLWDWLFANARMFRPDAGEEETRALVESTLGEFQFVPTAAKDALAFLLGQKPEACDSLEQTGVPKVKKIVATLAEHQIAGIRSRLRNDVSALDDAIVKALEEADALLGADIEAMTRALDQSETEIKEVQDVHAQQIEDLRADILERFHLVKETLRARIGEASARMVRESHKRIRNEADGIRFNTLKAAATRGGTFHSSTGKVVNFRDWIAGEITRQVPIAWSDLAAEQIGPRINAARERVIGSFEAFSAKVERIVRFNTDDPAALALMDKLIAANAKHAEAAVERAGEKVTNLLEGTTEKMQSKIDEVVDARVQSLVAIIAARYGRGSLAGAKVDLMNESEKVATESERACQKIVSDALEKIEKAVSTFCEKSLVEMDEIVNKLPATLLNAVERTKLAGPKELKADIDSALQSRPTQIVAA